MGRLLQEVRGGGQGQAISKSEVAAAADGILGPLMDLLDGEMEISRLVLSPLSLVEIMVSWCQLSYVIKTRQDLPCLELCHCVIRELVTATPLISS